MTRRLLPLLAALLALAGCGQEACGLRPVTEIPIRVAGGMPLVAMTINGRPATLVLDTGAQAFALGEAAVQRLGLITHASQPLSITGTGGASRRFAAVMQDNVLASGFRLPDTYAAVLPLDLPAPGGVPVDGLFGIGVLNRWEVDVNIPAGRMVLHEGLACPGPPPGFPQDAAAFTTEARQGGRFVIPIAVDGRNFSALADTGAQSSVLSHAAALALGVTQPMLDADPPRMLTGVGPGQVTARLHRFRSLQVGPDRRDDPLLLVLPPGDGEHAAILGFDYLAGRRLWFSNARRLMLIAR